MSIPLLWSDEKRKCVKTPLLLCRRSDQMHCCGQWFSMPTCAVFRCHFYCFSVLFLCFSAAVLSVLGNAAVLVSTARRLAFLKAPELLTVNLAVTDIGMALSMYPLSIASAFNHAWIGGDVSCLYYGLMGMIFSITSIMTLAVMGTVRYLVTGSPPKTGSVIIKFNLRGIKSKSNHKFILNTSGLGGNQCCKQEVVLSQWFTPWCKPNCEERFSYF